MSEDWRRKLKKYHPPPAAAPEPRDVDDEEDLPSMAELLGETGARPLRPRKPTTKAVRREVGGSPLDLDDMPDMETLLAGEEAEPPRPTQPEHALEGPPPSAMPVETEAMPEMDELLGEADFETVRGPIVARDADGVTVAVGPERHVQVPAARLDEDDLVAGDELLLELRPAGPFVRKTFRRERVRESAPTIPDVPLRGRGFVIDASNVCRGTAADGAASALAPLLCLVLELRRRGADAICVFDANEGYQLAGNPNEPNATAAYEDLLRDLSRYFVEAPGASAADETVLRLADRQGWRVISNDRFRKPDDPWCTQYPWLRFTADRLLQWDFHDAKLAIPDLRLTVPASGDPRGLVNQLRVLEQD